MASKAGEHRGNILSVSAGWLGVRYKWAGTTRAGVDCSGLTMNVYKAAAGISLPHSSLAQSVMGKKVTQAQAQAGDLVFFGFPVSHVGIWLGGGMVRHAPHTGAEVRDESLSSISSSVRLAGFRNYLGDAGKGSTVSSATGTGLVPPPSAGGPRGEVSAPSSTTSSSSSRKRTSASNAAAAHNVGFDWNPLHWPGDALGDVLGSGIVSDVEHAAMEAVIYGSLLAVGVGLILIGAAATARKAQQSSPGIPSIPGGGGGGGGSGGAAALPAEIPPIPV